MAIIANTAFEARISNKRNDVTLNVTGLFRTSDVADTCPAGFLCTRDGLAPNVGYTGVNNENTWYMEAAASTILVNEPIYACNTYDVRMLNDGTNQYAIGTNTLGVPVPAGRYGTFTQIEFNGKNRYRFGAGNLSTAISTNTFFTIAAGLLVPAAAAPTDNGVPYFKLIGTGTFTEGTSVGATYYDVEAHYAVA